MATPFIDLRAAHDEVGEELDAALRRVVESGWFLLGDELEAFETEFAAYCGVRHCVGVASGLSALELALAGAGVGAGDEVIVPAHTFVATWLAVSRVGAQPVPVDVLAETQNIDPDAARAAVTPQTAAIIPVHLRGEPADIDPITALAEQHGLVVIEDAAQAHGARHRSRRCGALGTCAAFSFYPSKNLGALGDAGAVTTDSDEIAERVRLLRNYGMAERGEISAAGTNSRMAELQAASLRVKLPHLDRWNETRRGLADLYRDALGADERIELTRTPEWAEPVWHLFTISHPERDRLRDALARGGIEALIHYPVPPHLTGAYREGGWGEGSFPVAERIAASTLSLPIYPQLAPRRCEEVATAVLEALQAVPAR